MPLLVYLLDGLYIEKGHSNPLSAGFVSNLTPFSCEYLQQTDSKVVAKQVESELLAVFDYAWNKGSNGNRRSRDILAKLFMVWPRNDAFCNPLFSGKKYIFCGTNAVGIKVALRKPLDAPSKSNNNKNLGYFVTPPLQVPVRLASLELRCGALTGQGTPCNSPPVKGRKRCLQHKGMRVRGAPAPTAAAGNAPLLPASEEFNVKRESVKVGGASVCLPRGFLGRRSRPKSRPVCSPDSKPVCKTECKEEPEVGRRQPSLSFNTWMKMENERGVHDSQEPFQWSQSNENEEVYADILLHKYVSAIPKHRVRQIGSKYTPVPVDDGKRR